MFCSCGNNETVEIKGLSDISTFTLATKPMWSEICVPEALIIPIQKPDVESLEKVIQNVKITSIKLIITPNSGTFTNSEGTKLTGNKVIVEGELQQKLFYTADEPTQSVHTANFSNPFSTYIVVIPNNDTTLEYSVDVCVEDVFVKVLNTREIIANVTLLLSASLPVSISSGIVPSTGTEIDLTMTNPLTGTAADPAAFTITSSGTAPTVNGVTVSGTTVTLTFGTNEAIKEGDIIMLKYAATGTTDLTGLDGNVVANFSNQPIENNSTPSSVSSGLVLSTGTEIDLTMINPLTGTAADPAAFTITSSGAVPNITVVAVSGTTVTITIGTAIKSVDVITLTYTATGTTDLTGLNGNVKNFTNKAITNNSTQV